MKKLAALMLAVIMIASTFAIVMPASAADNTKATHVYDFTREWESKAQMAPYSANITRTFSDEGMTLRAVASTNTYNSFYLTAMTADLQYMRVKVKNPSPRAGMIVHFTISNDRTFSGGTANATTATTVNFNKQTNDWQDVVGATGVAADTLTNAVGTFHFQMNGTFNTTESCYATFEYIAFFATEAEANAFDINAWRAANPEKTEADVTSDVPYILDFKNNWNGAYALAAANTGRLKEVEGVGATIYGTAHNNVPVFALHRMVNDVRYAVIRYKNTSSVAGVGIGFTSIEGVAQRFDHVAVPTIKTGMTEFETIVVDLADETIRSGKNANNTSGNKHFEGRAWGLSIEPLRTISAHCGTVAENDFQVEYIALFSTEAAANAYAADGTLPANTSAEATGVVDFAADNAESLTGMKLTNATGELVGDEYQLTATAVNLFGLDITVPEEYRNATYVKVGYTLSGSSELYFRTYFDSAKKAMGIWRGAQNNNQYAEGVWHVEYDRHMKTTSGNHFFSADPFRFYVKAAREGATLKLDYIAFFDSESEARSFSIEAYKEKLASVVTTDAVDVYSFDTDRAYEINNKIMPYSQYATVTLTEDGLNFKQTHSSAARQAFYFDANEGAIPAFVKIRVKTNATKAASEYMDLAFTSDSGVDLYNAAKFRFNRGTKAATLVYDGEFHEYMVPLDGTTRYAGSVDATVDGFQFLFNVDHTSEDPSFVIDYIAFFETEADAKHFGIEAWEAENAAAVNPGYAGPIVFDYTAEGAADRQLNTNGKGTFEYTEEGLKVTAGVTGATAEAPIVSYELGALASDIRFVKIKYKNDVARKRIQLSLSPNGAASYANTFRVAPTLETEMGDYIETVWDLTRQSNQGGSTFHGYANAFNLAFFYDGPVEGDTITVEYIAFCATAKEADEYNVELDRGFSDIEYSNVTLNENFNMSFAVEMDAQADWDGFYAQVTKNGVTTIIPSDEWKQTTIGGDAFLVVDFKGIVAKEMNEVITVVVYDSEDSRTSIVKEYTIKDYAMDMLNKTTDADAELRSLIVDMLNYGAHAQLVFGHDVDNLANSALTEEQQAYASAAREYTGSFEKNVAEGYEEYIDIKTNVILGNNIKFKFGFDIDYHARLSHDAKAIVTYTDHSGKEVSFEVQINNYEQQLFVVGIDTFSALDSAVVVTCTLVDGEEVIATASSSIESYVAGMTDETKLELATAMMKYCDAATAYFYRAN